MRFTGLTAAASGSHNLVETDPYNVLSQLFYDEVLSLPLREIRVVEGYTSRDPGTVTVLDDVSHLETDRFNMWLGSSGSCSVLLRLDHDGDWNATVAGKDADEADRVAGVVRRFFPGVPPVEGMAQVSFWTCGSFGPVATKRRLAAAKWEDVAGNYPSHVRADVVRLMQLRPPMTAGRLALWHGVPGTGKTHAIRALTQAWQDWCDIDYIVDTDEFFGNGHYMASTLLHTDSYDEGTDRWRLIVIEDAGEFVESGAKGQGLARLLNLADGLIGQGLQVMVLLTTNAAIDQLHPAMTRPGRCVSNIGFTGFDPDEAAEWLKARGLPAVTGEDSVTLAELYAVEHELMEAQRRESRQRVSEIVAQVENGAF